MLYLFLLEKDGEEERNESGEIHRVHPIAEEAQLAGAAGETEEVLQREVGGAEVVHQLDGATDPRELRGAALLLSLELLQRAQDEGDGGHAHNRQAGAGRHL